jgi:Rrf2 family protein
VLSSKAKYAIKATMFLARRTQAGQIQASEIAEGEQIPRKFLELILAELRNAGILQSKKGKGGGYILGRPANDLTLGEIIRVIDGPLAPIPCVSKLSYRRCEDCEDEVTCGVRLVMQQVRDATASILDGMTVADLLDTVDDAKAARRAAVMFHI